MVLLKLLKMFVDIVKRTTTSKMSLLINWDYYSRIKRTEIKMKQNDAYIHTQIRTKHEEKKNQITSLKACLKGAILREPSWQSC